jgi:putative ABC transport system permease protein
MSSPAWFSDMLRDARYAARQLRRAPAFAAVIILTLAGGIAATSVVFSIVNGVLLRDLPYAAPDRLVAVVGLGYKGEFVQLRDQALTVEVGAHGLEAAVSLTGEGEPVRLTSSAATSQLFAVLGVNAALGRVFRPEDTQPGAADSVILSHGFWQQRFGGTGDVVGRQLTIDGVGRTVIGVMPPDFRFPSGRVQLWTPLVIREADPIDLWAQSARMVGRLRDGATPAAARAELQAHVPRMRAMFPWRMPADYGAGADVVPLHEQVVGELRPALLVLLAAACAMLAIVFVNVANLLLARGLLRRRELAIRAAIGAGRGRLFRQMMAESLALAAVAGGLGILLAYTGLGAVRAWLPADMPRVDDVVVDARVLLFTSGVSLLAALLFGLWPALRVSTARLEPALRETGRTAGATTSQRRVARMLVVAEIALAVVLVTSAALLVRSFQNLTAVDPGFRTERLVTATVAPPEFRYGDAAARRELVGVLLERLRSAPGVTMASAATAMPLGAPAYGAVFSIEGRPDPATQSGEWPLAHVMASVDAGYFRTMGTPVVAGRGFTLEDRQGTERVALVSRSLAAQYWPGESPVGARIRLPGNSPWLTVVGVVADVKWSGLTEEDNRTLYVPMAQGNVSTVSFVVRTAGDPAATIASLRSMVAAVDGDIPVSDIRTAEALIGEAAAKPRFTASLIGLFAIVALFLGAVGVYGVLAHAVSQRRQEFGVRLALGAQTGDLFRQVLRHGLFVGLTGVALGLAMSLAATRALSSLLFGVSPADPAIYAGVAATLLGVAVLASLLPALHASRVDPLVALRSD